MKAEETSIPEDKLNTDSENAEDIAETEEQTDEPPETEDHEESLEEILQKKDALLAEERNNFLKLQAETDNFRKRLIREKEEFAQFANERLIKNLIPIYANLDRALTAPSPTIEGLKDGLDMILKQFASFLEKEKVEPVKALGESFDPSIHEVLSQVESDEHEENTVIQEYAKGYCLNGRILQPAKVVISKLPAKVEETEKKGEPKSKKKKNKESKH